MLSSFRTARWWCCVDSSHSFFRPLQVYNMEIGPFCVHRGCYRGEREKGKGSTYVVCFSCCSSRTPQSIQVHTALHSVLGWYHAGQHNRTLEVSSKARLRQLSRSVQQRDIPKPELVTFTVLVLTSLPGPAAGKPSLAPKPWRHHRHHHPTPPAQPLAAPEHDTASAATS